MPRATRGRKKTAARCRARLLRLIYRDSNPVVLFSTWGNCITDQTGVFLELGTNGAKVVGAAQTDRRVIYCRRCQYWTKIFWFHDDFAASTALHKLADLP